MIQSSVRLNIPLQYTAQLKYFKRVEKTMNVTNKNTDNNKPSFIDFDDVVFRRSRVGFTIVLCG